MLALRKTPIMKNSLGNWRATFVNIPEELISKLPITGKLNAETIRMKLGRGTESAIESASKILCTVRKDENYREEPFRGAIRSLAETFRQVASATSEFDFVVDTCIERGDAGKKPMFVMDILSGRKHSGILAENTILARLEIDVNAAGVMTSKCYGDCKTGSDGRTSSYTNGQVLSIGSEDCQKQLANLLENLHDLKDYVERPAYLYQYVLMNDFNATKPEIYTKFKRETVVFEPLEKTRPANEAKLPLPHDEPAWQTKMAA